MAPPILEIEKLAQRHKDGFRLQIDRFALHAGRAYALTGPNGSGKTTLLRILGLLTVPTEGRLLFEGKPLAQEDREAVQQYRRQVTLVMQSSFLFHTSVFNNVACGLRLRGLSDDIIRDRVSQALDEVGLKGYESRSAQRLSGGEAQRTALARALALKPKILLLDEPTASIDDAHAGQIESIIAESRAAREMTLVISTHQVEQAYRMADEVLSLRDGRLLEAGPANLFEGVVEDSPEGTRIILNDDVALYTTAMKRGPAHVRISPDDILVSRDRLASSARNSLKGKVTGVSVEEDRIRLDLDAGIRLTVHITQQSFTGMHLTAGDAVYATFKASAVQPV